MAEGGPRAVERAVEVDLDHPVELGIGHVLLLQALAVDGGVEFAVRALERRYRHDRLAHLFVARRQAKALGLMIQRGGGEQLRLNALRDLKRLGLFHRQGLAKLRRGGAQFRLQRAAVIGRGDIDIAH